MLVRTEVADQHCEGIHFEVGDIDILASAIALILVQEYSAATSLLQSSGPNPNSLLTKAAAADIVKRRLKPVDLSHRDGLLFQLMMWLASHMDLQPSDLVSLPHVQAAAKGQDSVIVHRSDGNVESISICEDKATKNARRVVRTEVWPEIKTYESGERWDELRSNVIATLGLGGISSTEAQALIRNIHWSGRRRYRVRITLHKPRKSNLFLGFKDHVAGAAGLRRGETTLLVPDVRLWMDTLAVKVEAELNKLAN